MGGTWPSLLVTVLAERWRIQLLSVSSDVVFFISRRICWRSSSACDKDCCCWAFLSGTPAPDTTTREGRQTAQHLLHLHWGKWTLKYSASQFKRNKESWNRIGRMCLFALTAKGNHAGQNTALIQEEPHCNQWITVIISQSATCLIPHAAGMIWNNVH